MLPCQIVLTVGQRRVGRPGNRFAFPLACRVSPPVDDRNSERPRFLGKGKIEFAEHPIPSLGARQLLLRVRANAICGTDRAQYFDGSEVVPGHEAVGTVVQTGAETSIGVGTSGAVYLMDFCGQCRSCSLGLTNQCLAKRADMGFTQDGGFGSYELVHETNFFPIPDDLSPVEATLLLDVMGTSGHAIRRARLVRPDIGANRSLLGAVTTHTYPVAQIGEAFQASLIGETGKAVVTQDAP